MQTAFGDSDEEALDQEHPVPDNTDHAFMPDNPVQPLPGLSSAPVPLDMVDFMHTCAAYDMHNVFIMQCKIKYQIILLRLLILLMIFLCLLLQTGFNPRDIPYRTMRTMSDRIIKQILPGKEIKKVDLHEGW